MSQIVATGQCFHCGEEIPPTTRLVAVIDGETRPVCCVGCQAVASLINTADMASFYRQRTEFAPQPEVVDQRVVDWFRDEDWLATFTTRQDAGICVPLMVGGMSCAACTWLIERFLLQRPEVRSVDVNLSQGRVEIVMAPDGDVAGAIEALLSLGYEVRPWRTDERLERLRRDNRRDLRRLGVAGLIMMQVGMFAIALHAGDLQGMDPDIQRLLRGFSAPLTLFALIYSGRTFLHNAWQHLRQGALIMDTSVALALLVATAASLWATIRGQGDTYYDSVTMFIFFLLLARYIERRLRDSDLFQLIRIEDTLPEFVNRRLDDHWQRVPRDRVAVGNILRVAAGEAIAFDGAVMAGASAVDESVFTGESIPRAVNPGDLVFAGTVNQEASIDVTVRSSYRDSRLASLADDVERARREKPRFLRLIDRVAGRFIALILGAAAVTAIAWLWIEPSRVIWSTLAVLVVACPCALSLATPAAMASATAWLRRHGVVVSGEYGLLAAAEADTVLIDKTGTLTETRLAVDSVVTSVLITPDHALELASALQQFSSHPAARAFHHLPGSGRVNAVEVIGGAGIEGEIGDQDGRRIRLGSEAFCRELAADTPRPPDPSHYWIGLVQEGAWLAWIGLAEHLRPGADAAIKRLSDLGLSITILSGDREDRVERIARRFSIPFAGGLSGSDKLARLQYLQRQQHKVIAVGDGLNDAPLLGAADASIAVSGATALARAQADFAVTEDNLEQLPTIVTVARKARAIMRQNLLWAAGYNTVGIPFAALGYVPPWLAALGMSLSSLMVVLNALRLRRIKV